MTNDRIYTVVRAEDDGYRTTPSLKRMTEQEAKEEVKRLKTQFPYQSFVALKEAFRAKRSDSVTVKSVVTEIPKGKPKPRLVKGDAEVIELRKEKR